MININIIYRFILMFKFSIPESKTQLFMLMPSVCLLQYIFYNLTEFGFWELYILLLLLLFDSWLLWLKSRHTLFFILQKIWNKQRAVEKIMRNVGKKLIKYSLFHFIESNHHCRIKWGKTDNNVLFFNRIKFDILTQC